MMEVGAISPIPKGLLPEWSLMPGPPSDGCDFCGAHDMKLIKRARVDGKLGLISIICKRSACWKSADVAAVRCYTRQLLRLTS